MIFAFAVVPDPAAPGASERCGTTLPFHQLVPPVSKQPSTFAEDPSASISEN